MMNSKISVDDDQIVCMQIEHDKWIQVVRRDFHIDEVNIERIDEDEVEHWVMKQEVKTAYSS